MFGGEAQPFQGLEARDFKATHLMSRTPLAEEHPDISLASGQIDLSIGVKRGATVSSFSFASRSI